jgi:hypothetical protein
MTARQQTLSTALRFLSLGSLLVALNCCADIKVTRPAPKRTWGEVKEEIDAAFAGCQQCISTVIHTVVRNQPQREFDLGGKSYASARPGTSVLEVTYRRYPHGRPNEAQVILDLRIERDYDADSGQASSFRILRHIATREGELMLREILSVFEKRKWPVQVIPWNPQQKDPQQKEPRQKGPDAEKEMSPVI